MTAALKSQWLEAMRSGRYAHTKSRLRDQHGFCALGVLCDTLDPKGWREEGPKGPRGPGWFHRGRRGGPCREVLAQAGLSGWAVLRIEHFNQFQEDNNGFAKSIEWIEKNL
jgi:hypothetical protein